MGSKTESEQPMGQSNWNIESEKIDGLDCGDTWLGFQPADESAARQVKLLYHKLRQYKLRVAEITRQRDNLAETCDCQEARIQDLSRRIEELESRHQQADDQRRNLESLQTLVGEQQELLCRRDAELEASHRRIEDLVRQIANQRQHYEELSRSRSTLLPEITGRAGQLTKEMRILRDQYEQELAARQREQQETKDIRSRLAGQTARLDQVCEELQDRIAQVSILQEEIDRHQHENRELRKQLGELRAALDQQRNLSIHSHEQMEAIAEEGRRLESLAQLREELKRLLKVEKALEAQLAELTESTRTEIDGLRSQVEDCEVSMEAQQQVFNCEKDALRDALQSKEERYQQLAEELERKAAELEGVRLELDRHKGLMQEIVEKLGGKPQPSAPVVAVPAPAPSVETAAMPTAVSDEADMRVASLMDQLEERTESLKKAHQTIRMLRGQGEGPVSYERPVKAEAPVSDLTAPEPTPSLAQKNVRQFLEQLEIRGRKAQKSPATHVPQAPAQAVEKKEPAQPKSLHRKLGILGGRK